MEKNSYLMLKVGKLILIMGASLGQSPQVQAATITSGDPTPEGISYEWTVQMSSSDTAELIRHVGAKSWNEPANPPGLKGWTHTSNWVALALTQPTELTLTVERAIDVPIDEISTAGNALIPAFSLYSGWEAAGEEDHQFNTMGNSAWADEIVYLDHEANEGGAFSVEGKFRLEAGFYSIAIGSNPLDPNLTGRHGYTATLSTAPVPEPFTLLGVATALGLGTLFKRQLHSQKQAEHKQ